MTHEERPITFTITKIKRGYRMYTKDGRVQDGNRDVEFDDWQLFTMMSFASGVYGNQGYEVLFEID